MVKLVSMSLVVAILFSLVPVAVATQPIDAVEPVEAVGTARESIEEIIPGVLVGRLELRSFAEPLSAAEKEAIRNEVIARAKAEGLLYPNIDPESIPTTTDQIVGVYVAYGLMVSSAGVGTYFGGAPNEEAVAPAHQRARQWFAEKLQRAQVELPTEPDPTPTIATTGSSPTQVIPGPGAAELSSAMPRTIQDSPYGAVKNDFELYRAVNDVSVEHDRFAVRQRFAMEPGFKLWNNDWRNHHGVLEQDWGSSPLAENLLEWEPGTMVSTATLNSSGETIEPAVVREILIGLGLALIEEVLTEIAIRWIFPEPLPGVTITPDASIVHRYAKWNMDFTHNSAASKTATAFQPGSGAQTKEHRRGKHHILDVKAFGQFRDPHWLPWGTKYKTIHNCWGWKDVTHDYGIGERFLVGVHTKWMENHVVKPTEIGFEARWPHTDVVVHHDPTLGDLMRDLAANRLDVVLSAIPLAQTGVNPVNFEEYVLNHPGGKVYVITLRWDIREAMHFSTTAASAKPARADDYVNYLFEKYPG